MGRVYVLSPSPKPDNEDTEDPLSRHSCDLFSSESEVYESSTLLESDGDVAETASSSASSAFSASSAPRIGNLESYLHHLEFVLITNISVDD